MRPGSEDQPNLAAAPAELPGEQTGRPEVSTGNWRREGFLLPGAWGGGAGEASQRRLDAGRILKAQGVVVGAGGGGERGSGTGVGPDRGLGQAKAKGHARRLLVQLHARSAQLTISKQIKAANIAAFRSHSCPGILNMLEHFKLQTTS